MSRSVVPFLAFSIVVGGVLCAATAWLPWFIMSPTPTLPVNATAWPEPDVHVGIVTADDIAWWIPASHERATVIEGRLVLPPGDEGSGEVAVPTVIPRALNGWAAPLSFRSALEARPRWTMLGIAPEELKDLVTTDRYSSGWPLACVEGLQFTFATNRAMYMVSSRGVVFTDRVRSYGLLPVEPIVFAVLIDWLFWSVVAALLWISGARCARLARAHHRRGRGQCTACGHSRHGLAVEVACPECGFVERS